MKIQYPEVPLSIGERAEERLLIPPLISQGMGA